MTSTMLLADAQEVNSNEDYVYDMDGSLAYSNASNCTNDYCIPDQDYIEMMFNHIYPDSYDWALIAMHSIVFSIGLIGNSLVCLAVYRNYSMRTVTNYFIVNLAVADLLVIIICLPSTVLWDVTETWFLGLHLCKIVPYLQVRLYFIISFNYSPSIGLNSKLYGIIQNVLALFHRIRRN